MWSTEIIKQASIEWLDHAIAKGKRIFDIGRDLARPISEFHQAEEDLLKGAGYVKKFVRYIMVNGKPVQLFEWTKQ